MTKRSSSASWDDTHVLARNVPREEERRPGGADEAEARILVRGLVLDRHSQIGVSVADLLVR